MDRFLPQKVEKEVISMRIVSDTLADIDKKAAETGISRNEFINQCIAFALANMAAAGEAPK
jgi:predicted DNA binding CopG/RHH family protein